MTREYIDAAGAIWQHVAVLLDSIAPIIQRRRRQLVSVDVYGVEETEAWEKEKRHIIEKVVMPNSDTGSLFQEVLSFSEKELKEELAWLFSVVNEQIETIASAEPSPSADEMSASVSELSPDDFEQLCAEQLRTLGWIVRCTGGVGDQGVDIIAEANGRRLVVQCKLYSSAVGNAAVQEVFSGMRHEDAHWAAVVTNADFTRSARQLANSTGVLLIHLDDLRNLSPDRLRQQL